MAFPAGRLAHESPNTLLAPETPQSLQGSSIPFARLVRRWRAHVPAKRDGETVDRQYRCRPIDLSTRGTAIRDGEGDIQECHPRHDARHEGGQPHRAPSRRHVAVRRATSASHRRPESVAPGWLPHNLRNILLPR